MKEKIIYLDNCIFNRLFDDQSSIRIKLETEAKLYIQTKQLVEKIRCILSLPNLFPSLARRS